MKVPIQNMIFFLIKKLHETIEFHLKFETDVLKNIIYLGVYWRAVLDYHHWIVKCHVVNGESFLDSDELVFYAV